MLFRRKSKSKTRVDRTRRVGFQNLEDRRLLAGDDQISEAISIGLYSTTMAEIDNFDDVDMYEISLTAGQQIGIDIDVPDLSLDPGLRIFDSAGVELDGSDDDKGPAPEYSDLESFLIFEAPSTGSFYIGVSSFSNFSYDPITGLGDADGDSTGEYELIIDDPPVFLDFVVDTIGDLPDANVGDGVAEDVNGDTSLRAAIEESNAAGIAGDSIVSITFNIDPADEDPTTGRFVTKPLTPLPAIEQPVDINAFDLITANFPPFQIDGSMVSGTNTDGLVISGFGIEVDGLAISDFPGDGVQFQDAGNSSLGSSYIYDNGANGVRVSNSFNSDISGNSIFDNTRSGIQALNGSGGLFIDGNIIGQNPVGSGEGPIPAGNGIYGIHLLSGFNTIFGNTVVANGSIGIAVTSAAASDNIIQGNSVGTDFSGDATLGNGSYGILIKSSNNEIGGIDENFSNNVISGNARSGLVISGSAANNNTVYGNRIGTDFTGSIAVPNGAYGVLVTGGANNTIGGDELFEGNVISGNTGSGIALSNLANGNTVENNLIGLESTNSQPLPNGGVGVYVRANAFNNDILNNFIAGNSGSQVSLVGGATSDNRFRGNMIGFGDDFVFVPGGGAGMAIRSPNNVVGGPLESDANYISGSSTGISLAGLSARDNVIEGNFIGTSTGFPNGTPFPLITGILFTQGARDNMIGPDNTIAYSDTDAIRSVSGGNRNTFTQNSIFNNGFGIDLAGNGPTANDPGDADIGPNQIQNNPVAFSASATLDGSLEVESLSFDYFIDSDPANAAYPLTVELFVSSAAQGAVYVASDEFTVADFQAGSRSIVITSFANDIPEGSEFGTATVTDADGNTSEFTPEVQIEVLGVGTAAATNGVVDSAFFSPMDTNQNGSVSPADALNVIDSLSNRAQGEQVDFSTIAHLDVNRDGRVSPQDALSIIDYLSDQRARQTRDAVSQALSVDNVITDVIDDDEYGLDVELF